MPGNGGGQRRYGRRVNRASRPYISGLSASQTVGRLYPSSKARQRTSLASKAASVSDLRSAVISNAKALDAVKEREFGYWQTTNSTLGGNTPFEHYGHSYNELETKYPALIHLNNLNSVNGDMPDRPTDFGPHLVGSPEIEADPQQGGCHIMRKHYVDATPGTDGLVRKFHVADRFSVNGVMQKEKRTGPHLYNQYGYPGRKAGQDKPLIPIPNGRKLRWGGTRLEFKIEGALQNTQFDFFIVKCNKEPPLDWDPWHVNIPSEARSVPGTLPYTIDDFADISIEGYPKKFPDHRYTILQHRRVFVNNVHRVTGQTAWNHLDPDNARYATGHTWSLHESDKGPSGYFPTHPATTPAHQSLVMSYKPNKIVRPLKNFIGEDLDAQGVVGTAADANPLEPATFGTMSWDNFHPSANVWLVMTTNHTRIYTPKVKGPYSYENIKTRQPTAWVEAPDKDTRDGYNFSHPVQWFGQTHEPLHFTKWTAELGTAVREDQLKYWMDKKEWNNSTQEWQYQAGEVNVIPGGWIYEEWLALTTERKNHDLYRNPRIHIFRRTWWQDEYIPSDDDPDRIALSKDEMQIHHSQPTTPADDVKAAGMDMAAGSALKIKHQEDKQTAAEIRNVRQKTIASGQPDQNLDGNKGINMSSHNVNDWVPYGVGHDLYFEGASLSSTALDIVSALAKNTGLLDYFFPGFTRVYRALSYAYAQAVQPHPFDLMEQTEKMQSFFPKNEKSWPIHPGLRPPQGNRLKDEA